MRAGAYQACWPNPDPRAFIQGSTLGHNFNWILPIGKTEALKASKRSSADQLDADTP